MRHIPLFVSIALFLGPAVSMPLFILSSAKPRCVTVTAPHSTILRIDYEAPDLGASGAKDRGVSIVVTPKVLKPSSVNSAKELNAHFQTQLQGIKKHAVMQEPITQAEGSFVYETMQNGQVDVCLRANAASAQNPMRFALSIEEESEIHVHDIDEEATSTDRHLTHMELEMQHLMQSMKNIIAEADFGKEREAHFHQQTLSMLAASMWWPIVQLCVLLLTGFTQANHVVRFLKTKRLI